MNGSMRGIDGNDAGANRRRESRHPLRTTAILERRDGARVFGSTLNVSGSGVLLDLEQGARLSLGEQIVCSIQIYQGRPPQPWGVGTVVRADEGRVAIQFTGLDWDSTEPARIR